MIFILYLLLNICYTIYDSFVITDKILNTLIIFKEVYFNIHIVHSYTKYEPTFITIS
jgi:hypothetical protein